MWYYNGYPNPGNSFSSVGKMWRGCVNHFVKCFAIFENVSLGKQNKKAGKITNYAAGIIFPRRNIRKTHKNAPLTRGIFSGLFIVNPPPYPSLRTFH
jgi:hypothetical protein